MKNKDKKVDYRDAVNGQYVKKVEADKRPRETVKETRKKK